MGSRRSPLSPYPSSSPPTATRHDWRCTRPRKRPSSACPRLRRLLAIPILPGEGGPPLFHGTSSTLFREATPSIFDIYLLAPLSSRHGQEEVKSWNSPESYHGNPQRCRRRPALERLLWPRRSGGLATALPGPWPGGGFGQQEQMQKGTASGLSRDEDPETELPSHYLGHEGRMDKHLRLPRGAKQGRGGEIPKSGGPG